MAGGVNKVILIGNLGQDPEVRVTGGGTAVANMRIACNDRFKNKSGEWEDRTEWVTVVAFGKTAENCREFLQKGRQIYVEGRLQTRSWEDKEGNKRYTTEVVANQVLFLGGKGGGGATAGGSDEPPPISDDDIPF
ncbi:MAG: single-stranded DNA-binding protein [Deltaproteobacteria bacterium]|nr:single-stranded DNA-binding protein [Deltaproteobacteria bacterium]